MLTKTKLASALNISRSGVYYEAKQPIKDLKLKTEIEEVLSANPSYGHKRIAPVLSRNKKSVLRVMNLFGIRPFRRRVKKLRKKADEKQPVMPYPNLLKQSAISCPGWVWAADFTYLKFQNRWIYLATIIDCFTKEILGWAVSVRHDSELLMEALRQAFAHNQQPQIHHSDQGSEYRSQIYLDALSENQIRISMSKKASPWENGEMEAFYSQFKVDLGAPNRFEDLGQLIAEIHKQIHYYNHQRIHSNFKRLSPVQFRKQWELNQATLNSISSQQKRSIVFSETVCDKRGA